MVKCEVCDTPYKVITQLHLKKHGLTLDTYLERFPLAKIRDDYECVYCGKEVINGKSSKSKYCATVYCEICAKDIPKSIGNNTNDEGHLMDIHHWKNAEYLEAFSKAKLLSCSEQVNKENVLYNVRQYNARKKRYVQRAFREANHEYGIEVDETREEYIQRRSSISTFAVLHEGIWYESGSMGWWGCVSDEKDKDAWKKEWWGLVNNVDDDTLLSIYDCHI